jgi:hypothetical protein
MGATVTLAATAVSARVLLGGQPEAPGTKHQYRIVNPGTTLAYVRFGDSTVVATSADVPVLPGTALILTFQVPDGVTGGLYLAAIMATGTATLSITTGVGIA